MKNYYELLEINENASQEVIERVYKLWAKKYHPDLNPDNKEEAEIKFKEITEAYEVLADAEKRKSYDAKLESQRKKEASQKGANSNNNSNFYSQYSNTGTKSNASRTETSESTQEKEEKRNNNEETIQILNDIIAQNITQNQEEREYQIKKAYNDAYYEALQSMGVKVVYKKTFKEKVASIVRILIFLIILVIIVLIVWQIPDVRDKFNSLFSLFKR